MAHVNESMIESLASNVIASWRNGDEPSASDFFANHPGLSGRKSLVLDLAYEEYCLRTEAGETIAPSTFCDRFPSYRRSLRRLLDVHSCMEQDPKLANSLEAIKWPEPDSCFLDFDLIEEIGRGAFARVFLATEPALGNRHVVVKVARGGGGEAETLGRLDHRNIVPIYSIRRDEESCLTAICMPYLGGATLDDVLDGAFTSAKAASKANVIPAVARRLATMRDIPAAHSEADRQLTRGDYVGGVVHLVAQLADALDHAHRRGVFHMDLKPSNVLVTPAGRPMLLDFNLSHDQQRDVSRLGGTLPYMSPEQLAATVFGSRSDAERSRPRRQWDIFSLGVILYELLVGRTPFGDRLPGEANEQAAERILALQRDGCPPIRSRNAAVPARLAHLVDECLQIEWNQRPASAGQLAARLRTYLIPTARLTRWMRRRQLLVGLTGSAVALAGGVGVAWRVTRAPIGLRRYLAGVEAFDGGAYQEAIEQFGLAKQAIPAAFQPIMAQGQARTVSREYRSAVDDFEDVLKRLSARQSRSPQSSTETHSLQTAAHLIHCQGVSAVWLAICYHYVGMSVAEANVLQRAIETFGLHDAGTWNNRGRNAASRHFLTKAIAYLDRAIQIDPQCQEAYYNRALVYRSLCEQHAADIPEYGPRAIGDIEMAVRLGPLSGNLMYHAALILVRCGRDRVDQVRVQDYLCRAFDLGVEKSPILNDISFTSFLNQRVLEHPVATAKIVDTDRIVQPRPYFPPLTAEDLT